MLLIIHIQLLPPRLKHYIPLSFLSSFSSCSEPKRNITVDWKISVSKVLASFSRQFNSFAIFLYSKTSSQKGKEPQTQFETMPSSTTIKHDELPLVDREDKVKTNCEFNLYELQN